MSLYSQAIEFYEQQDNPRYYDFQDRMHKMLIKPQVISALQRLNCPPSLDSPIPSSTTSEAIAQVPKEPLHKPHIETIPSPILKSSFLQKLKEPSHEEFMNIRKEQAEQTRKQLSKELNKTLSKPKTKRNFNMIIDRHTDTTKETATKAAADFKSQDFALERRLASRKKIQLTKSMTFTSYTSNDFSRVFGCDLSDVDEENNSSTKSSFFILDEPSSENYEKFEKRLEEIMEKNFSERSAKIAELKFRYETQINEIHGMGDIMDLLIKQMRNNMQEEIDSVVQEYDIKRKEEIKRLKEELCS